MKTRSTKRYRQEYRDLAEARASLGCFIDKIYNQEATALGARLPPPVEFPKKRWRRPAARELDHDAASAMTPGEEMLRARDGALPQVVIGIGVAAGKMGTGAGEDGLT